jgi:glycosyltransferase involved in cell wall biosynthesis
VPSVIEAFGLVLVESMATGPAVVASEVGGIPEVVTDGVTGLLVPPQSAAALSQAIVRLHGDPALRARLGAQGVQEVTKRFQLDRMLADYKDVYLELTRHHVGAGPTPASAPDMAYDVTASP